MQLDFIGMGELRNQKLKAYVDGLIAQNKCNKYSDFAVKIGKNVSQVGEVIRGNRTLSNKFIADVKECFSDLDASWILDDNNKDLSFPLEQYKISASKVQTAQKEAQAEPELLKSIVESQKADIAKLEADKAELKTANKTLQEQIDRLLGIIEKLQK